MHTNGDEIVRYLEDAISDLSRLPYRIYSPTDINGIMSAVGAKLELYFKAVIFPKEPPRHAFVHFIGCLSGQASQQDIGALHDFRKTYNSAKHDPAFEIPLLEAQKKLHSVKDALVRISDLSLGLTKQPHASSTKRVYWLAAWDHYIGGDTEIHIMVPSISKCFMGPLGFDMIYIEGSKWDEAKSALAGAGHLDNWEGHIPESYVSAWESEGEFLSANIFEGEYRDLITSLGKFEKRQDLIYGLNRADSAQYVFIACLMALADISASLVEPGDMDSEVVQQVTSTYSLPATALGLTKIARDLVAMLRKAAWSDLTPLIGPLWATSDEFLQLASAAIVRSDTLPVMVDSNRRLIARHN
jgi:hypothetical protein